MAIEKSIKPNGYALRSWGDVVAVATLLSLFLGCVAWGLKLEARYDTQQLIYNADIKELNRDVAALKAIVSRGILPRSEERIDRIDETDKLIIKRIEALEGKH